MGVSFQTMNDNQKSMTIIIVTWNNEQTVGSCLESIGLTQKGLVRKIIVVDNHSSDNTIKKIEAQPLPLTLIKNSRNRGFAAAVNQGLAQSEGDYILLLNPDAWLQENALQEMAKALDRHADIDVVGPQLLHDNGTLQPSGRRLPSLAGMVAEHGLPRAWKNSSWMIKRIFGRTDFTRSAVVAEVSGACFLARAAAFQQNGVLDERFFLYFEETDWFQRLAQKGGRVLYWPDAKVVHQWGHSMAQIKTASDQIFFTSQSLYCRKHFSWWQQGCYRLFMALAGMIGLLICLIIFKPRRGFGHYGFMLTLALSSWGKRSRP